MKNKFKIIGIIALVAIMASLSACVTSSTIGGTAGPHGLFGQGKSVAEGGTEIASYSVILGLVDAGYAEYDAAVKAAEKAGKKVVSTTTWYYVLYKVTAYAY